MSTTDENEELLMYLGRFWHIIQANYLHMEVMFFIWTTSTMASYLYVIHSPDKHYKWLELFAFLYGIIPHKRTGDYIFEFIL